MLAGFRTYLEERIQISEDQWLAVADELTAKTVKKGTILLRQEDICSEVFFVTKGLLRSYTVDESGKEHILQFAPEHWWIADRNSFYYGDPSLFFVDAIEDSELVIMTRSFEAKMKGLVPAYLEFNTMALHNAIRFMQRRINQLLSATAEERYLDFINLYPNVTLRVPQWMIASYLGITPESLSRVRKELARRNFRPQ